MKFEDKSTIQTARSVDFMVNLARRNQKCSHQQMVTADTDSNFSIECDELLESLSEFCEEIQIKGYANVKSTCEVLKKYKMMEEFKACIDQHWSQVEKAMQIFLQADKQIMKAYSEIKNKALECHQQIQGSENADQLGQLIRILQESTKLKLQRKKVKLARSDQSYIEDQFKVWKNSKLQMEHAENLIKDYALKLVEVVLEKTDIYSYDDDQETKKQNSQSYFMLRSKIAQQLDSKIAPQSSILAQNSLKLNLPNISQFKLSNININGRTKRSKAETQRNSRNSQMKQDILISKILDLYKHN